MRVFVVFLVITMLTRTSLSFKSLGDSITAMVDKAIKDANSATEKITKEANKMTEDIMDSAQKAKENADSSDNVYTKKVIITREPVTRVIEKDGKKITMTDSEHTVITSSPSMTVINKGDGISHTVINNSDYVSSSSTDYVQSSEDINL
jgi:hypothetical protein